MFLKDTEQMDEAQVLSLQIQCSFLHSFLPSLIYLSTINKPGTLPIAGHPVGKKTSPPFPGSLYCRRKGQEIRQ